MGKPTNSIPAAFARSLICGRSRWYFLTFSAAASFNDELLCLYLTVTSTTNATASSTKIKSDFDLNDIIHLPHPYTWVLEHCPILPLSLIANGLTDGIVSFNPEILSYWTVSNYVGCCLTECCNVCKSERSHHACSLPVILLWGKHQLQCSYQLPVRHASLPY